MSRYNKQAITVLGAASIALQTVANSFEVSPAYKTKLQQAHAQILVACRQWPGVGQVSEGAWMSSRLRTWTAQVKSDIRLGPWVMCTLTAVAIQAVTWLYERPSSRLQRPLLDPLFPLLQEIFNTVEGGVESSYESNKLAEKMLERLFELIE